MQDSRRLGRWVLALIAILATADAIGAAFSPYLLVHEPLALLALNADDRHVVLLAGRVELPYIFAIAVPRRLLSATAAYGFGACYGRAAIGWAEQRWERIAKIARWFERLLARAGAPLLVIMPGYTLGVLSGASGSIRFWTFLPCIALGQLVLISADYFFGSAIAAWTSALLAFFEAHAIESTAVFVAIVLTDRIARWIVRKRRQTRELNDPTGL